MTQSQMITARMAGFKAFRRKVKKMLDAHPGMSYKRAAGYVKNGIKPDGPELSFMSRQEQPAPEKHQQFVLVIGDGAYKLLSMSNGNGAVEVTQLPFSVVKL